MVGSRTYFRRKLCTTAALNCQTGQNKDRYCKKELLLLLVSLPESNTQSKNGLNFQASASTISAKILLTCLVELFMIQIFKYLYDLDVKVGRKGTLAVCSASSAILSYLRSSKYVHSIQVVSNQMLQLLCLYPRTVAVLALSNKHAELSKQGKFV